MSQPLTQRRVESSPPAAIEKPIIAAMIEEIVDLAERTLRTLMASRCLWSVSVCVHYESVNYHFGPLVRTRMVNVERLILVAKPWNIQAQLALIDQRQCHGFLQRSFHRIHL